MSLRRKSCSRCFRSRRKCDLSYPSCSSCHRSGIDCRYAYPPLPILEVSSQKIQSVEHGMLRHMSRTSSPRGLPSAGQQLPDKDFLDQASPTTWTFNHMSQLQQFQDRMGPQMTIGSLGVFPPVKGEGLWSWALDQIRTYPQMFSQQGETVFIHKSLNEQQQLPKSLRAAFGICAASTQMNDGNKTMIYNAIDAEIRELLLATPSDMTNANLMETLATLQAAVLYQTIRLYHGGAQECLVAEQQEYLVRAFALALLNRANAELTLVRQTYETWLLAESIRRTVVIAFKVYTMYWSFRKAVCVEAQGLNALPVSTRPELWISGEKYQELVANKADEVITHGEISGRDGGTAMLSNVEPFQNMLRLGCRKHPGRWEPEIVNHC